MEFRDCITDRMLCHCLQVKESQVADSVAIYGAETVRDVIRTCGAGGGCNSCHAKIRQLIEAHGVTDAIADEMQAAV
ncbi:MAG: (2Fe-2S)-binding protein [Planctomycetaceae bacterium]